MLVYNLILCLSFINIFIRNKVFLFLTVFILCFFCGLRNNVLGYDFFVYKEYYNQILTQGNVFGYEPFFYYMSYLFRSAGLSFNSFLFFVSLFFHLSLYYLLITLNRRLFINAGIVLSAYVSTIYFWHSYTLVRQSLSIAVFYYVFAFTLNSSGKKCYFINFLGVGFHISHVVSIAYQLAKDIKFSLKLLICCGGVFLVFYFYSPVLMAKISQYSTGVTASIFPLIEFIFSFFVILCLCDNERKNLLLIASAAIIISIMGAYVSEVLIRFVEPFRIVVPIGFAYLFCYVNKSSRELGFVYLLFFMMYCFFRLNVFMYGFGDYALPYQSII